MYSEFCLFRGNSASADKSSISFKENNLNIVAASSKFFCFWCLNDLRSLSG